MSAETFSIYLTGVDISNREMAIEALSRLFKCTPSTVKNQLANPDVPIKKGLSSTVANQYMTAIERAGGRCESRDETAAGLVLDLERPVDLPLDLPVVLPEEASVLPELFPASQAHPPIEPAVAAADAESPFIAMVPPPRKSRFKPRHAWILLAIIVLAIGCSAYAYFFPHGFGPHALDHALKLDVSTNASFEAFNKNGGVEEDPYWRGYRVTSVQTSYNSAGRLDYFIVHFTAIEGSGYKFPSILNLESSLAQECGKKWDSSDGSARTKSDGRSCGISIEKEAATAYVMNDNSE